MKTKKALAAFLVVSMIFTIVSINVLARETNSLSTTRPTYKGSVRSTIITKYFSQYDENGIYIGRERAGANCKFFIYGENSELLATVVTDENGSFDLAQISEVYEYLGFYDGNLFPDDLSNGTNIYIVDAESIENESSEDVSIFDVQDDGALAGDKELIKIKQSAIDIEGRENVPCIVYNFKNFYHVYCAGWRIGRNTEKNQIHIKVNGDAIVAGGYGDMGDGIALPDGRFAPKSGKAYDYKYVKNGNVIEFSFGEQNVSYTFENDELEQANYVLLWMRLQPGLVMSGTANGVSFTLNEAFNYPLLLPIEDPTNYTVSGTFTFTYGEDFDWTTKKGEAVNFQIKSLVLPPCSANFLSTKSKVEVNATPMVTTTPKVEVDATPVNPNDDKKYVTIVFDSNDGTGLTKSIVVEAGTNVLTLPSDSFVAPKGKEFLCWGMNANDTLNGTALLPNTSVCLGKNTKLYAIWTDSSNAMGTIMGDSITEVENSSLDENNTKEYSKNNQKSNFSIPQTGDYNNVIIWFVLMLACACTMLYVVILNKRKFISK